MGKGWVVFHSVPDYVPVIEMKEQNMKSQSGLSSDWTLPNCIEISPTQWD